MENCILYAELFLAEQYDSMYQSAYAEQLRSTEVSVGIICAGNTRFRYSGGTVQIDSVEINNSARNTHVSTVELIGMKHLSGKPDDKND